MGTSSSPPMISLSSSQPSTISCSAQGYPLPSITWYKNNILISSSINHDSGLGETSSILTLPCQEEMVAEYTCCYSWGDETATATTEVVTEEDDECQELM